MTKIKTVDYLVQELLKLGITDVFGLPGDYNFDIIEAVERNNDTNWVGCTNELNAGYAADGYARIKGYGALITTYGVGELSAMNAIAGSYAESVPVVHIVGVPKTKDIKNNTLLHHNFASPDYYAFERAFSNVTAATAYLDETNAKEEIDRVLGVLINEKKPVYIAIPIDICSLEIENNSEINVQKSDEDNLNAALEHALEVLNKAKQPVIMADILIERFGALKEARSFIERSGYPVTTLLMGKGLIDFNYENFIGTYVGKFDNYNTYEYVNKSDCVITVGAILSDLNTFGFDLKFNPSDFIQIYGAYTVIENHRYDNVLMADILEKLSQNCPQKEFNLPERVYSFGKSKNPESKKLQSSYIYLRMQEFLRENDVIFSETGIVKFGMAPVRLPQGANLYNQVLWGSIGWATPAAFGAGIALRNNPEKRVVLITGEGSHQLTAQEISSIMRYNLKPVIIVLNNHGYTIERVLSKDPMDAFNDIAIWNYSKLPHVFKGDVWTAQASTEFEFDEVLKQAEDKQKTKMCYIEIFADKMDLPELAQRTIKNRLAGKPAIA